MEQITLTSQPVHVAQSWLLENLEGAHFGPGEDPVNRLESDYEMRVGDSPIVRNLRKLFELGNKQLPAEIAALKGEPYLIAHAIGARASENPNNIDRLTYTASFDGYG